MTQDYIQVSGIKIYKNVKPLKITTMHNFKELKIWQMSREFVSDIYKVTRQLPPEEMFVLVSQMRRAAISIPSNISEGAGRMSDKDFMRFIDISSGSAFEVETQLYLCFDQNYLRGTELENYLDKVRKIQKMLCKFRLTLSH
jgi:four helix bundle protein